MVVVYLNTLDGNFL